MGELMRFDNGEQEYAGPRNVEAEMQIVGAMLQDNGRIDYAADRLKEVDFYEPIHGLLFSMIVAEHSKGHPVNPVSLKPMLGDWPALEELGGAAYLVKLTGEAGALIGFTGFVDQVANLSRRRAMYDGLAKASAMAADLEQPIDNIITTADGAVSNNEAQDGVVQLSGQQAFDNMLLAHQNPTYGVKCGVIEPLDAVLGSIRPKELIIMAARPGMGKTACALSYSLGAAQEGHGVLFVSLEMSATELAGRMASDMSYSSGAMIAYDSFKNGRLGRDTSVEIAQIRTRIGELPIRIVDAGKLTTGRLSMLVMRNKRRLEAIGQTLDLVVVDYLQLLTPDANTRSIYEKISEVSIALKGIAKTHGVAVMALAQLSREVEKRPDKRPQLSDLRDSGQIEQDADGVLFLLRQAYYEQQNRPDDPDESWLDRYARMENEMEFIVAKRRNGITGNAKGSFFGKYQAVRG